MIRDIWRVYFSLLHLYARVSGVFFSFFFSIRMTLACNIHSSYKVTGSKELGEYGSRAGSGMWNSEVSLLMLLLAKFLQTFPSLFKSSSPQHLSSTKKLGVEAVHSDLKCAHKWLSSTVCLNNLPWWVSTLKTEYHFDFLIFLVKSILTVFCFCTSVIHVNLKYTT